LLRAFRFAARIRADSFRTEAALLPPRGRIQRYTFC